MFAPGCRVSTATFDQSVTGPPVRGLPTIELSHKVGNVNRSMFVTAGILTRSRTAWTGSAQVTEFVYATSPPGSPGGHLAHHSGQECDPSKEDIDTTNKITQALKYVGVRVLDHIIVGRARQDYFSFARAGMV